MADLSSFMPEVLPFCPGLPAPAALTAILNAAIEFCARSHLWRVTDDPMPLKAGVSTYDLTPPEGVLVDLLNVVVPTPPNGAPPSSLFGYAQPGWPLAILPEAPAVLDRTDANWRTTQGPMPLRYTQEAKGQIQFWPVPSIDLTPGVVITYAVKPSRSDTTVPDLLYEDWLDTLAAGALARLLLMPDTGWFNAPLAAIKQARFDQGVRQASLNAARGNTRADQRVEPRLFGFY